MKIENLDYYVKFVFQLKNDDPEDDQDFVTSDISALKEFVTVTEFNIGDILNTGNISCKIENISLKHINEVSRSNKFGYNKNESSMQGHLKDSLITIVIECRAI